MVSQEGPTWVLLSYRVPREPSTPRIAIWRKLKSLGVAQIGDGLVALPHDARTREHLEWIAAQVIEAGGDAILWQATPMPRAVGRQLADEMNQARNAEYQTLLDQVAHHTDGSLRTLAKLRREWNRIAKRDFFGASLREPARAAIETHAGEVGVQR